MENQYGAMKSLSAFTSYKVYVSDCDQGRIRYGVFNIHTKHEGKAFIKYKIKGINY